MLTSIRPLTFQKEISLSVAILTLWFATVAIFSFNAIWRVLPFWVFPLVAVSGVILPFLAYLKVAGFRVLMDSIPINSLTRFHIWRIAAGIYLLKLGADGVLPTTFAHNAGYGDLTIGIMALLFLINRRSRFQYLTFHTLSMIDFVVAVGTGLTFTLLHVPLMEHIQSFPVALIPGFGVGVTGSLSLITLRRLNP